MSHAQARVPLCPQCQSIPDHAQIQNAGRGDRRGDLFCRLFNHHI
jgi:hypothetical protein